MENIKVTLEIELSTGRSVEIEATFEYEGGLDGIGPYEFQGQKFFDKGKWRVEGVWFKSFVVCNDETLTAAEKLEIEIFCENYAESGNVEEKIYNQEN